MNLNTFLKTVDDRLANITEEQAKSFIHELARNFDEDYRLPFLQALNRASENKPETALKEGDTDIHDEVSEICGILEKINEGDRSLGSEINEEYDDWYNPDADEILIHDPEGILPDIDHACEMVHRCIDCECYGDAEKLLRALEWTDVPIEGDYPDINGGDSISVQELAETSAFSGNWNQIVLDGVFGCYMNEPAELRPEKIFDLISDSGGARVKLEELMRCGDHDLPDFGQFLADWQEYLASQTENESFRHGQIYAFKVSDLARRLLQEASELNPTAEDAINTARKLGETEPSLYLTAVEKCFENDETDKGLRFIPEALQRLRMSENAERVRAAVAGIGVAPAESAGQLDLAEQLRAEKFRAMPTPENYLDLAMHCFSFDEKFHDEVSEMITAGLTDLKNPHPFDSRTDLYTVAFLDGDFERALDEGMSFPEPIGWTGTFMKEGIALFMLGSYEGTSEELPPALKKMIQKSGIEGFENDFDEWRKMREIPEDIKKKAIAKAENAIEKRTEAILGCHRNYYGECADYIAAIGEVRESRGEKGVKNQILQKYDSTYRRYRAFRAELKRYL